MKKLGDRVSYENHGDIHVFRVQRTIFALLIYAFFFFMLAYIQFYGLLFFVVLGAFIDYFGYKDIIIDIGKEEISKRLGIFSFNLPPSKIIKGFESIKFILSRRYSFGGEAPVKDIFAIEIVSGNEKIDLYSSSDYKFIEQLREKVNRIHDFNWNLNSEH
jgi:hypothetical protein